MNRKLVLLNVVLIALAGAAAWQIFARWREGQSREQKLVRPVLKRIESPALAAARPPQPASAAGYSEVAQRMLFSKDRNPNVIEEVEQPKPIPPFPVAYGTMDFGKGPVILLSEKPGAPSRAYAAGATVGEFTLAALDREEVVLEFDGQQYRKKVRELRPEPGAVIEAGEAPKPAEPQASPVQSRTTNSRLDAPGGNLVGDLKACVVGDTSPAGTVRDGYRKVMNPSAFGTSCHWEPVR